MSLMVHPYGSFDYLMHPIPAPPRVDLVKG
jgi:hypothetical protein